jgi:hypothetical protein
MNRFDDSDDESKIHHPSTRTAHETIGIHRHTGHSTVRGPSSVPLLVLVLVVPVVLSLSTGTMYK